MTEPPLDDREERPAGEQDVPNQSELDAETAAHHDPLGLDVAQRITAGLLNSAGLLSRFGAGSTTSGHRGRRRRRSGGGKSRDPDADDRAPQPVGQALNRLYEARGWDAELGVRALLTRWPELVGQMNAQHSHPESYADGVLVVRAESSTWASALRSIAPNLVAELNSQLGDGIVRRIEVRGPTAPSWKHGPRSVRDGRGPRDTYG